MAGTLTISTLSDGTNSTSSTNCIQGSAKAWVSFSVSGGVCTRLSSYNVSSVTYNSTGNYTVNFTNALTDANYSYAGSALTTGTGTAYFGTVCLNYNNPTKTTTAIRLYVWGNSNANTNLITSTDVTFVAFR